MDVREINFILSLFQIGVVLKGRQIILQGTLCFYDLLTLVKTIHLLMVNNFFFFQMSLSANGVFSLVEKFVCI